MEHEEQVKSVNEDIKNKEDQDKAKDNDHDMDIKEDSNKKEKNDDSSEKENEHKKQDHVESEVDENERAIKGAIARLKENGKDEKCELLDTLEESVHKLFKSKNEEKIKLSEKEEAVKDVIWNIEVCLWHGLKITIGHDISLFDPFQASLWTFVSQLGDDKIVAEEKDNEMRTRINEAYKKTLESSVCESDLARSRYWVRVALNTKCLFSSLNLLLLSKQCAHALNTMYEPWSILKDDESLAILFSIVGVLSEISFDIDIDDTGFNQREAPPTRNSKYIDEEKGIGAVVIEGLANLVGIGDVQDKPKDTDIHSETASQASAAIHSHASKDHKDTTAHGTSASYVGTIASAIQSTLFGSSTKSLPAQPAPAVAKPQTPPQSYFSYLWGSSTSITTSKTPELFGKTLSVLIKSPSTCAAAPLDWEIGIPDVIARCLAILMTESAIKTQELFTNALIDQDSSLIAPLKDSFVSLGSHGLPQPWYDILDKSKIDDEQLLKHSGNPNLFVVIALVKQFFRQLPEPLISYDSYDELLATFEFEADMQISKIKVILEASRPETIPTLCAVFGMINYVKLQIAENTSSGLAAAFASSLLRSRSHNVRQRRNSVGSIGSQTSSPGKKPSKDVEILRIMIENHERIFSYLDQNLEIKRNLLANKVESSYTIHHEIREVISPFTSSDQEALMRRLWQILSPEHPDGIKNKVDRARTRMRRNSLSQLMEIAESSRAMVSKGSEKSTSDFESGNHVKSDGRRNSLNNNEVEEHDHDDEIGSEVGDDRLNEIETASRADFAPVSEGWRIRGFQTAHPTHELRGGGVACLKFLVYFAERFPEKARLMVSRTPFLGYRKQFKPYPFALAAVQVTQITADFLGLATPQIDLQKLATSQAWYLLGEDDAANRIFALIFLIMDSEWNLFADDTWDMAKLKDETHNIVKGFLSAHPKSIQALWDLWMEKKRMRIDSLQLTDTHDDDNRSELTASSLRKDDELTSAAKLLDIHDNNNRKRRKDGENDELETGTNYESGDEDEEDNKTVIDEEDEYIKVGKHGSFLFKSTPSSHVGIKSEIFKQDIHANAIDSILPPACRGYNYEIIFSSFKHGENIELFLERSKQFSLTLLVIEDLNGQVFGGFSTTAWDIHPGYYGTGESFLFSFHGDERGFRHYSWTGKNNYFQFSNHDCIGMGGGGFGFGIYLDRDLKQGTSNISETFANEILSSTPDFICKYVELWTFVPRLHTPSLRSVDMEKRQSISATSMDNTILERL